HIGGTSASTPLLAGMISLLNDIRMSIGKPPLGFLNYWIYQQLNSGLPAYNDITVGNNACSADKQYCCAYGFPAQKSWDAVTGVGTPNFQALVEIAKKY